MKGNYIVNLALHFGIRSASFIFTSFVEYDGMDLFEE